MRLVYIIDCHKAEGVEFPFRMPTFVARLICRAANRTQRGGAWDYVPTPEGL